MFGVTLIGSVVDVGKILVVVAGMGGATATGAADVAFSRIFEGTGGAVASGAAEVAFSRVYEGNGTVSASGEAVVALSRVYTASGTVSASGTAPVAFARVYSGSGGAIASGHGWVGEVHNFEWEQGGPDFMLGDLLLARRMDYGRDGQRLAVMEVRGIVQSIDAEGEANVEIVDGSEYLDGFGEGIEFVRVGSKTDATRRGSVYLTSDDSDGPFIDVYDGVDDFAKFADIGTIKVRVGNLNGITDANFGTLSGYGLYTENVYLKGTVAGGSATSLTAGVGYWLNKTGDFRVGDPAGHHMTWEVGTGILSIAGSISVVTGSIAGLTISSTALTATAGGNSTVISSGATAFACGPTGVPTFFVTQAGALTATLATITGAITATSGEISGNLLVSGMLRTHAAADTGLKFSATGFRAWNASNVQTVEIHPDGYGWFGTTGVRAISWTVAGVVTIGGFTATATAFYTGTKVAFDDANAGVHLGTDGIGFGNNVFTVSPAGALIATSATITGAITATSGTIGGFTVNVTDGLYSGTGATRVQMKAGAGIWCGATAIGDAPFSVTQAGVLSASGATISGTLTATSGTIGGFTVNASDGLYSGTGATRVQMKAGAGIWCGATAIGDAPFSVTQAGVLSASGATISGTLTATAGTIGGWTLSSTSLSNTSAGNTVTLSTGSVALIAGPTGTPAFSLTQAGALTCSDITITGGSVPSAVLMQLYNVPMMIAGTINISTGDWTGVQMRWTYQGTTRTYTITNGTGSSKKYIYWLCADPTNTTQAFTATDSIPSITGQYVTLMAFKDAGGVYRVSMFQNAIFADMISCAQLSAINTNTGTLTVNASGYIKMGQTAYDSGTGFWFGDDGGTPKLSIGNSAGTKLTWNGTTLSITGYVTVGGAAADVNAGATTISGGKITATSIAADRLNVSTLSAITANLGTVTAGSITGLTITGGTIQTAATGQRIVLNSSTNRMDVYDGIGLVGGIQGSSGEINVDCTFSSEGALKTGTSILWGQYNTGSIYFKILKPGTAVNTATLPFTRDCDIWTSATHPTSVSGYGITDACPVAGSSSITTVGALTAGSINWSGAIATSGTLTVGNASTNSSATIYYNGTTGNVRPPALITGLCLFNATAAPSGDQYSSPSLVLKHYSYNNSKYGGAGSAENSWYVQNWGFTTSDAAGGVLAFTCRRPNDTDAYGKTYTSFVIDEIGRTLIGYVKDQSSHGGGYEGVYGFRGENFGSHSIILANNVDVGWSENSINAWLNINGGVLKVTGTQVVGAQGAAVADATDAASVIARLNDLLARLRTHGLIAT